VSRILVIGGYGGFGGRLSARLAEDGHHVLVGGRNFAKAEAFCAELRECLSARATTTPFGLSLSKPCPSSSAAGQEREGFDRLSPNGEGADPLHTRAAEPILIDRNGDIASVLAATRPDLVVDAAGPFQDSGYAVPHACIAARIPYLDLADGRAFVAGISGLDAAARAAGVALVSGASSLPALTGAVVRALAEGIDRVESVEAALSASNRASGGASVVAAILSYVGQPIRLWRGGRWTIGRGWQELRRVDFAVAGAAPLPGRLVALVDVPDLELIPDLLPGRPAVAFRAGTELAFQMLGLWLASWPVRWGWLRSLRPLAPLLLRLYHATLGLGGARSAMHVVLCGWRDGRPVERIWTIVAEKGEGLHIPTLAAQLLAGDILAARLAPGARTAAGLLTLDRFEPLFARLAVRHETAERDLPPPLYARAMGPAFNALPPSVRALHDVSADSGAAGEAVVTRGRGRLVALVARLMRLPPPGRWPLHLAIAARNGGETWIRDYGGHVMTSALTHRSGGVVERFGPIRFAFDLEPRPDGLAMPLVGWSLFHLPLPRALAPRISAVEREQDGRFHFDVRAALPLAGEVARYAGWLESVAGSDSHQ
jgi:saccharopine dehydrogenase-like NADP-dependent oxidoreductase